MINLDELEALAKAATAESWQVFWGSHIGVEENGKRILLAQFYDRYEDDFPNAANNIVFIAAAHPQNILTLIDEIRQLQRAIQQYEEAAGEMSRTIINQGAVIERLKTALGATQPPPATPPYHRLAFDAQLVPCSDCSQEAVDRYLLRDGCIKNLCRACAEEQGAILAD